jgi:hypothetical protein
MEGEMRFKVVAAFSVVLIILGVASLGTMLQDLSEGVREDTYLGGTMAGWFLTGGALLYWAARKRYSVGLRIYVGAFLVFFGFVGAAIEADNIVNLRAEEPVFGFVLAGAFVTAGLLLARSGYWRNARQAASWSGQPSEGAVGWPVPEKASGDPVVASEEVVATGATRDN